MNKYKEKYQKVVDELIKKSFPILKNKRFWLLEMKGSFSAGVVKIPFVLVLVTHPRLRDYDKEKLIGIFTHELAHLELFEKHPVKYYLFQGFHFLSKSLTKKDEMETDKIAIRKGYAHQLYSQRKSRWNAKDKYAKRLRKSYLSPKEIKTYAIKEGKW